MISQQLLKIYLSEYLSLENSQLDVAFQIKIRRFIYCVMVANWAFVEKTHLYCLANHYFRRN